MFAYSGLLFNRSHTQARIRSWGFVYFEVWSWGRGPSQVRAGLYTYTYVVAPSYLAWGGASVVGGGGGAARGFDVTLLLAESLTT